MIETINSDVVHLSCRSRPDLGPGGPLVPEAPFLRINKIAVLHQLALELRVHGGACFAFRTTDLGLLQARAGGMFVFADHLGLGFRGL